MLVPQAFDDLVPSPPHRGRGLGSWGQCMPRHPHREYSRANIIARALLIVGIELSSSVALAVAGEITFEVKEPSGVGRVDWPVTSGVPFARGELRDPNRI